MPKDRILSNHMRTIGVIAGRGVYPETFIAAARRQAEPIRVVLVAFKGETDESLVEKPTLTSGSRWGNLAKWGTFYKKRECPKP